MRKKDPFTLDFGPETESKPRKPLDWEESAVDELSLVEGFSQKISIQNLVWLRLFLFVCFVVLASRLVYLQVFLGDHFSDFAQKNRLREQSILAPRGLIKDRFGEILAKNTASYNLTAVPFDLPKNDLKAYLESLSKLIKFNPLEAEKQILSYNLTSIEPVIIAQNISLEESVLFETKASEFIGFSVQKVPVRDYSMPEAYFHLLGYAGLVNPADLKSSLQNTYAPIDFIGKSGVEQAYESYLRGKNGFTQIEVDARGNLLSKLGTKEPEGGKTLVLNIDKALQEALYKALKRPLGKGRAAAVAINPKSGEVLAFLSLPGLDGSKFARGFSHNEYNKIVSDKALPLFNRVIQGTYPPGSTVKPMVAGAALQEKIIDETTIYRDSGVLVIPNQYNPKINYNFYGWKRDGLGLVDVKLAIAKSSDIFFYIISGGYPQANYPGLGVDKLSDYYLKFGLGKPTGIDLPGEKGGLVPNPQWKAQYYKTDPVLSKWYLGDTYHLGIGQGDLLVTPLQVALWTGTFANNGVAMQPQILKKVVESDSEQVIFEQSPQVLIPAFLDFKNIKLAQEGMRETVLTGSGRLLNTLPISSAGKTGTSQFDSSDPQKTHAWFTAYAPYEDPQIVITVLIEAGGEGSSVAVPVVYETLNWWAKNRY